MKLSKIKQTLYGNLRTVKMRRRHGLFTAEGLKAVADLSSHFIGEAIIITPEAECDDILTRSFSNVYETSPCEMKAMSSFSTPSPVMGVFRIPEKQENVPEIDEEEFYLLLDGVRDPGNLGTIIRTCHWFGIKKILASYDTVDCYNPKTVQATMGSLGAVIVEYCDLPKLIRNHPGMPVYGTLLEGENIFEVETERRGFLVMGNEGTGISENVRKLITKSLNIPPATTDHGESLNVAVATAVALTQFRL